MKENVSGASIAPMLFPYEPDAFWQMMRRVIQEVSKEERQKPTAPLYETPGLTYKPLYKMSEVCALFQVSKPTIYDWIKHQKLKPVKIRSRVFFLWQDIEQLLQPPAEP